MKQDNPQQAVNLAYVAGYFDGEGSIGSGINAGPKQNSLILRVRISQSDLAHLEVVQELIGISSTIYEDAKHNKLSKKPCYSLTYNGSRACEFAKLLLPYVRQKRSYLEWLIETWEGPRTREFLEQQHRNRPGRRAAAETKRGDTHVE